MAHTLPDGETDGADSIGFLPTQWSVVLAVAHADPDRPAESHYPASRSSNFAVLVPTMLKRIRIPLLALVFAWAFTPVLWTADGQPHARLGVFSRLFPTIFCGGTLILVVRFLWWFFRGCTESVRTILVAIGITRGLLFGAPLIGELIGDPLARVS
jgi:hypothetical protein